MNARSTAAVTALLASVALAPLPALAARDMVVTLCQEDTQQGDGINLSDALLNVAHERGGRITFACGANAVIVVKGSHLIRGVTELAGDGKVTLDFQGETAWLYGDTTEYWDHPTPVDASATLIVSGMTLTRTHGPQGAGMLAGYMNVEIHSSTIRSSHHGVGFWGQTLLVEDSQFNDNDGTALTAAYAPKCRVVIRRTQFTGNKGEHGAALTSYCDTTIEKSQFSNNTVTGSGGAIYLGHPYFGNAWLPPESSKQTVTIRTTTFDSNSALAAGGAIAVQAGPVARDLTIRYSHFKNNSASLGGAIELGVTAPLPGAPGNSDIVVRALRTSFTKNTARQTGGAIDMAQRATLHLARAVFTDNSAQQAGGAIKMMQAIQGSDSLFGNVLFARNAAPFGAALVASAATLEYCTIAGNTSGPALAVVPAPAGGPVTLKEVIVANNPGGNCDPQSASSIVDGDRNLQYPEQSCGASITAADPKLDGLYIPGWLSPALGAGEFATCMADPVNGVDLLGQSRRRPCAIGALETDPRRPAALAGITIKQPDRNDIGAAVAAAGGLGNGSGNGSGSGGCSGSGRDDASAATRGCGCGAGRDVGGPLALLAVLGAWARLRRARLNACAAPRV